MPKRNSNRRLRALSACLAAGLALPAWAAPGQASTVFPLEKAEIVAVHSPYCGEEAVGGQPATRCRHGEGMLTVVVREYGYGKKPKASLNGEEIPLAQTESLCEGPGGKPTTACRKGQATIGFQRKFRVGGDWKAGVFEYTNRSMIPPWNPVAARIEIL
jgi:hypothetical protein